MNTALVSNPSSSEMRNRLYRRTDYAARRKFRQRRLDMTGKEESRQEMASRVKDLIHRQPDASDFLLSLFVSALLSYRRAEVCEPYPDEFFHEDGEKDFETVKLYAEALPDVQHFLARDEYISNLPTPALRLLRWIIDPQLYDGLEVNRIPLAQYKQEIAGAVVGSQGLHSDPQYVYKINYSDHHMYYQKFQELKAQFGSRIGFHGSPFENFHSIIRNGLDATFSKETSLYGEGIYLSEDRDVAYSFLKPGLNKLRGSMLGDQVGCLVVAEVAQHPEHARTHQNAVTTAVGIDSESQLPKGYIVVDDNEYLLIRYILVYNNFGAVAKKKINVCWYIAMFYVMLLLLLWMSRNLFFSRYYNRLMGSF